MTIGVTQIGHSADEGGVGTVRIGRRVVEDMTGSMRGCFSDDEDVGRAFWEASRLTEISFEDGGKEGSIGGGNSMFSAALRDNWRAKSEACHHSRNLSAKILVGSRILSELSNRGVTLIAMFLGEKIEPPSPGLAGPIFLGAVASSIAL